MKKQYFLLAFLLATFSLQAQTIYFGDSELGHLLAYSTGTESSIAKDINGNNIRVDTNYDYQIQVSEALNVYHLNIAMNSNMVINLIDSMEGIEYFTNLRTLNCSSHYLDELDVTALVNLEELNCNYTYLDNLYVSGLSHLKVLKCAQVNATSLNLTGLTALENLDCYNSDIQSLNLSHCPNLKTFAFAYANYFTSLNVSGLQHLEQISVYGANVPTLTLSNLPSLKKVWWYDNETAVLNLSGLPNLEELYCYQNDLTSLPLIGLDNLKKLECNDNQIAGTFFVSDKPNLQVLKCQNNQITQLFTKNGYTWSTYDIAFYGNDNLNYICAEDDLYNFFRSKVYGSGIPPSQVEINSYCSFAPGGIYYTVQGDTKYDLDSNGCSASDIVMANQHFTVFDGLSTGSVISDASGHYSLLLHPGNYEITPHLEMPQYFNLTPTSMTIGFPGTNPVNQNFCLTANGTHPDLEIYAIPVTSARPGFDATYKINFRNKGTTQQSGTVQMHFDDDRMDLVLASPAASSQTAFNLNWDFVNLQPFESREITVTFNLNTPTETQPLNGGHTLIYEMAVLGAATDDTPSDNLFNLRQEVVNSFDPNDKTCLEGTTVGTNVIGDYVHYVVRFENTGTANAENIVVKDLIDLQKFDITTLVPLSGSHNFITRINDNRVEFIMENINLPFDDAHNDGYVSFKIKTSTMLMAGSTFSNAASIYFDYNHPVVTDPAVTTIAVLGVSDFDFDDYLKIYPNPADHILNINTKMTLEIQSIEVYNLLGQLAASFTATGNNAALDVSSLAKGAYFLKINTDKGSSSAKFLKN